MAKILCVLYPDPVDGYPKSYARDDIPVITRYDNGQIVPTPKHIDFVPGELLGSVSGELGLRKYLESSGHQFVVTSDKEDENSSAVTKRCSNPQRGISQQESFGPPVLVLLWTGLRSRLS